MLSTLFALLLTVSRAFDVPVFWPILVLYFFVLSFLTCRRRVAHMIKHGYVPWDYGKKAMPL